MTYGIQELVRIREHRPDTLFFVNSDSNVISRHNMLLYTLDDTGECRTTYENTNPATWPTENHTEIPSSIAPTLFTITRVGDDYVIPQFGPEKYQTVTLGTKKKRTYLRNGDRLLIHVLCTMSITNLSIKQFTLYTYDTQTKEYIPESRECPSHINDAFNPIGLFC